ncbi:hypothetical protein B0H19DRAFT_1371588 [Mycena capillaripes]|nr:hypothetical protein B0H19DRAFT_1371588 [Mycena capillaripes]
MHSGAHILSAILVSIVVELRRLECRVLLACCACGRDLANHIAPLGHLLALATNLKLSAPLSTGVLRLLPTMPFRDEAGGARSPGTPAPFLRVWHPSDDA